MRKGARVESQQQLHGDGYLPQGRTNDSGDVPFAREASPAQACVSFMISMIQSEVNSIVEPHSSKFRVACRKRIIIHSWRIISIHGVEKETTLQSQCAYCKKHASKHGQ
jgi:hypothetical protein